MSVIEEVFGHLVDAGVTEPVVDLVLAAIDGPQALNDALQGLTVSRPSGSAGPVTVKPPSVYLSDITVSGFRGVGPASSISFVPGPGLTVVVGRNGSGKSSFFDALEVALTGDSHRWKGRPAEWRDGWRNLHQTSGASVVARFQTEGMVGPTTLERSWADSAQKVDDATAWAQHHGKPRTDLEGLGWVEPMSLYRPVLATSEVGSIASQTPSQLFDSMSSVLGLEEMTAAGEVLRRARLEREKLDKEAKAELKDRVVPMLEALDDPRARSCLGSVSGRSWDLDALAAVAVGGGQKPNAALGALAELNAPPVDQVAAAAARLRSAAQSMQAVEGSDSARARRLADLLSTAVEHHSDHGDGKCPVCGAGTLDEAWHRQAQHQVDALREQAGAYDRASGELKGAMAEAKALTAPMALPGSSPVAIESLTAAVDAWRGLPDDPDAAARHLEDHHPRLVAAVEAVASQARQAFSAAEEEWRPVAAAVAAWVERAREAITARSQVDRLKSAEAAAKDAGGALRSRRFEPIANQAVGLWETLRLQSNVELTSIELSGAGASRRVDLEVRVDGTEGAALGVVSQGEINCLALSLFFPRATLPESPFRFIVIDDPVQAMDPARVDGLAKVFSEAAKDRQVIVFTHDDRLPESLRRLGLAHTSMEVTRRPGSVVKVRETLDPVRQYFNDARAVASDHELPDGVAARVVPGLCRLGLEAAFTTRARRALLSKGASHVDVDRRVEEARKITDIAALALFGDKAEGSRVLPEMNKWGKEFGDVYRDCNEGAHKGFRGSLKELVNTAGALAARIQS